MNDAQQGMSFLGESEQTSDQAAKFRTKAGALSSATLKAIQWYSVENGLKLAASSAVPIMSFIDSDGTEHTVNVNTVIASYKEFKARTHGKKREA